jgi:integrase
VTGGPSTDQAAALFGEMLEGFSNFQTARGRNPDSIAKQLSSLTGLVAWAHAWPWQWTAELIDAWSAYLKGECKLARSTLRGRQGATRLFVSYLINPAYAWTTSCRELFGVAPTQVCFDWNTSRHLEGYEGAAERRPLDDAEKQRLFAAADARVEAARTSSDKGLVTCWRDATMIKLLYGSGCRISELVALELADLHRHPVSDVHLRRVFREVCQAAGLDGLVVPHVLRHTYFTDMAARGRDVRWRQTQAGHKLLSSQQIYDHVTSDQMNRELERALAAVLGRTTINGTKGRGG